MSTWSPLGAYRPGTTALHRLRPGAKLLGLFAFGLIVFLVSGWVAKVCLLGVAFVLAIAGGMRGRQLGRIALGFAVVGALLFAFQWWQHGWERGVEVVAGLFALILAASTVTATTAVDDMLDTVTWALTPLRVLGAAPEKIALAFSLAIRSIPLAFALARDTREAARARGLDRSPRAHLVPFVLRLVEHARATGAALEARGVDD